MLRTLDYVEAYSLTRLSIAALASMAIVAIGLALICWRMLRSKSTSWLINSNCAVASFVLAAFCFVDTRAMAAAWNVRHAREVGGKGAALDLCYLNSLGGSALLSLVHLEQQRLAPRFAARVRRVRDDVLGDVAREQRNGAWTVRNARRLHEARQRLGNTAPFAGNNWDCAGRLFTVMAPSEAKWRDRLAALEAEDAKMRKEQEEVRRQLLFPEEFALFELKHWRKAGFGSVMTVTGTIRNKSRFALKDFTLQCELSAPSGTLVDRNVKIIYEQVAAGSSKVVRELNMGFITDQSATTSCKIVRVVRA